jgi:hypothetical protein
MQITLANSDTQNLAALVITGIFMTQASPEVWKEYYAFLARNRDGSIRGPIDTAATKEDLVTAVYEMAEIQGALAVAPLGLAIRGGEQI